MGEENIDTLTQTYLALLARKPFVWLMFTTGGAIVSQAGELLFIHLFTCSLFYFSFY